MDSKNIISAPFFQNKKIEGGLVVKAVSIKANELHRYEKMVQSLNIEEFLELTNGFDLNKSFEPEKVKIRKKYIFKYYKEWLLFIYKNTIQTAINSAPLKNYAKQWLMSASEKPEIYEGYGRFGKLKLLHSIIKRIILYKRRKHMSCIVFLINKKGVRKKSNYAYIYLTIQPTTLSIDPIYICLGPGLLSSEGEYRKGLVTYRNISIIKSMFIDILSDVEEYLLTKNLKLTQNFYLAPHHPDKAVSSINKFIKSNRIAISILTIVWTVQGYMWTNKLQYKCMEKEYNKNMFIEDDKKFINNLIIIYGDKTFKKLVSLSSSLYIIPSRPINNIYAHMGQKIIPLTNNDINNEWDISSDAWREFYIGKKITNLLVNTICPGVPIIYDWFLIYGSDKHLFNNPAIIKLIILSDQLNNANAEHKQALKASFYGPNRSGRQDALLSDYKKNDVDIYTSSKALVIVSEHVGRPIGDLAYLLESKEYRSNITSVFANIDDFSNHFFSIIYTLLCMNSKCGVIHGDLHLNNVTIHHYKKNI
jgi:hypothetical protein